VAVPEIGTTSSLVLILVVLGITAAVSLYKDASDRQDSTSIGRL
jgi:hypothetical protein